MDCVGGDGCRDRCVMATRVHACPSDLVRYGRASAAEEGGLWNALGNRSDARAASGYFCCGRDTDRACGCRKRSVFEKKCVSP